MKITSTGLGVVSPIGIGLSSFCTALKKGHSNFTILELNHLKQQYKFPAALVAEFNFKEAITSLVKEPTIAKKAKRIRNLSEGAMHGIYAALDAWQNANLFESPITPERVALVASGSNTQLATSYKIQEHYREKLNFLNPTYGFRFFDSDIIGTLSELLNIRGEGFSIGAASASGNMAIIQSCRLLASNLYDIVLVVAPSMELSIYEYQAFTTLGAMAPITSNCDINKICNPFDKAQSGFVYGQNAGAIVLESIDSAKRRKVKIGPKIIAYGTSMDANRNPNPSKLGETKAMQAAMDMAQIDIDQLDYINTHGTASNIGDKTEVEAILSFGRKNLKANATKSLIGHGITSAGLVEVIASCLQLEEQFLHINPALKNPISNQIDWVLNPHHKVNLHKVLCNSFGFGGINSSIILSK